MPGDYFTVYVKVEVAGLVGSTPESGAPVQPDPAWNRVALYPKLAGRLVPPVMIADLTLTRKVSVPVRVTLLRQRDCPCPVPAPKAVRS